MHPFFQTLADALLTARPAPARIRFVIVGLHPERVLIELTPKRCHSIFSNDDTPVDLTVYCDRRQLDRMLREGRSVTPLRAHGRVELLDELAELIRPPLTLLEARSR